LRSDTTAVSARYHPVAEAEEGVMATGRSADERLTRLLTKAIRTLPQRDQDAVLRDLLRAFMERAPSGAVETAAVISGAGVPEGAAGGGLAFGLHPGSGHVLLADEPATSQEAGHRETPSYRMVPVRLPEEQYARFKSWCGDHGFSMAVVVRGLLERFLAQQATA
jgi:hypothetical protein